MSREFPEVPRLAPDAMTRGRQTPGRFAGDPFDALAEFERAEELLRLREVVASWPATRPELVARLREEIARGRYRADEDRIAVGLLEEDATLRAEQGTIRP